MMKSSKSLKAQVMQFLQENGWERSVSSDKSLIRYSTSGKGLDRPVSIFLSIDPTSEEVSEREINEALSTLRQFYGVPFAEVRHSVRTLTDVSEHRHDVGRDILTSRVPDRHVFQDTIDIHLASTTLMFLRDAIEAAAAVRTSERELIGSPSREAKQYATSCRFGHTFRGSFGFLVECPLERPSQLTLDLFEPSAPTGRQVSERLARGFHSVQQAHKREDPALIVQQTNGLDAKMCRQLGEYLNKAGLTSVSFAIEFDRTLPTTLEIPDRTFEISYETIPLLRAAEDLMQPTEPESEENVIGRVVILKASGNPLEDETGKREITVKWETSEGKRNVVMQLKPRDYAEAIRAHEQGLHVQVRGSIRRSGGRFSFVEVLSFAVLD